MVNRLAKESSAYLRSAAHQPVDWYPWGEEAFARARAEDKPILLDIGAVWCHWCHVIDRESYEDSKLAQLINERFIPVKVDRDERPDVDTRYQAAVNALAGQGGWPLTAFLTPNGKVFYGGTYFPPKDGMGRPSFRRVLEAVSDHYGNERKQAIADAENLHAALSTMPSVAAFEGEINDALLREVLDRVRGQFDLVNGGFGTTPKFPHPGTVEWLLARFHRTRDRAIGNLIAGTLTGMANGGIRDHVGGGFHRYSTDAQWIVPHFEKMAYDNAYLLLNFVHGWQVFRDPLLRETAKDVLRFVDGVLSDRDRGGFYASQDADVGLDDDGDFFTWTLDEVKGIVSDDELRVLQLRYDLYEKGEMRHNPKKNVLYGDKTSEEIASVLGLPLKTVDGQIASGLRKLRDARSKRPAPFVDTTIYANWNGMMIKAYFEAGSALRLPDVTAFARTSLDFVLREMVDPTVGVRHAWKDGKRGVAGLLDDHVEIADACLAAYEATGVLSYLETATAIADFVLERFWDAKEGGFFDTASGLAPTDGVAALEVRRKPIEDSPSPSANGVAAQVLMKLFHLTGRNVYRDRVDALIRAFAGTASRYGGIFAGAYFHAAELWLHPPAQVVIIGSPDDERTRRLRAAAVSTFSPGRTVALAEDSAHVPRAAETAVRSRKPTDPPAAFVCRGNVCFPPTDSPTKLVELLGMRSGA